MRGAILSSVVVRGRVDVKDQFVEHRLDLLEEGLLFAILNACPVIASRSLLEQVGVNCVEQDCAQIEKAEHKDERILPSGQ